MFASNRRISAKFLANFAAEGEQEPLVLQNHSINKVDENSHELDSIIHAFHYIDIVPCPEIITHIPKDVLVEIAQYLDKTDIISLFLVNKATLSLFDDYNGNKHTQRLRVNLSDGEKCVSVPFQAVNHLLLASYCTREKLEKAQADKARLVKRRCYDRFRVFNGIAGPAVFGFAATHFSGIVFLDQYFLPKKLAEAIQLGKGYKYGGHYCANTIPNLGVDCYGQNIAEVVYNNSMTEYRSALCGIVYTFWPCFASIPITLGISAILSYLSFYKPTIFPEGSACRAHYDNKIKTEQLDATIDSIQGLTMRYTSNFNEELRQRNQSTLTSICIFKPPAIIKMDDELHFTEETQQEHTIYPDRIIMD